MFNAFTRELILLSKRTCGPGVKTAVKKTYRLFDAQSPRYLRDFLNRMDDAVSPSAATDDATPVFPGITSRELRRAVGDDQARKACDTLIGGIVLAASLAQSDASADVVSAVSRAVCAKSPDLARDYILDDDLFALLETVAAGQLSDGLLQSLPATRTSTSASRAGSGGSSIFDLAREISESVDMSSLLAGEGSGGPDMQTLMQSINTRVQERMQDGSVDPAQLCEQAQSILRNLR